MKEQKLPAVIAQAQLFTHVHKKLRYRCFAENRTEQLHCSHIVGIGFEVHYHFALKNVKFIGNFLNLFPDRTFAAENAAGNFTVGSV